MRRAARVDTNQAEIVAGLRADGFKVCEIKEPVDLLVGFPGGWLPMEVKRAKGYRITDQQRQFMASAPGPYALVSDLESARRAVRLASGYTVVRVAGNLGNVPGGPGVD